MLVSLYMFRWPCDLTCRFDAWSTSLVVLPMYAGILVAQWETKHANFEREILAFSKKLAFSTDCFLLHFEHHQKCPLTFGDCFSSVGLQYPTCVLTRSMLHIRIYNAFALHVVHDACLSLQLSWILNIFMFTKIKISNFQRRIKYWPHIYTLVFQRNWTSYRVPLPLAIIMHTKRYCTCASLNVHNMPTNLYHNYNKNPQERCPGLV